MVKPWRCIPRGLRDGRWWLATSSGLWSAPLGLPHFPVTPPPGSRTLNWLPWAWCDVRQCGGRSRWPDGRARKAGRGRMPFGWASPGRMRWTESTEGISEEWTGLYSDGIRLWATTPIRRVGDDRAIGCPVRFGRRRVRFTSQPNGAAAAQGAGCWVANAHSGSFVVGCRMARSCLRGPFAPNGPRSKRAGWIAWNDRLWVATGGTESSGVPLYRRRDSADERHVLVGDCAARRRGRRRGCPGPHGREH